MATVNVIAGNRQVPIEVVAPDAQVSKDAAAVVTGSELDARGWKSLAYTILMAAKTVTWWVYGANAADYSDEVIVNGPTDVAAATAGSYAVAQAPYAYYRVKIKSKDAGQHGTASVRGIAKP